MKKSRKEKLPLIAGAFCFMIAALQSLEQQAIYTTVFYLIVVFLNLFSLRLISKYPFLINFLLNILNAIACGIVFFEMLYLGKKGLPYAYLIATIGFTLVSFIYLYKMFVRKKLYLHLKSKK